MSNLSRTAKQVGIAIKQHAMISTQPPQRAISYVASSLRRSFPADRIGQVLGPDVVLVPAPGSSLLKPDSLWVPRLICEALVAEGLGQLVLPCIERTRAVPKSAFAAPGERPTLETHYDTIEATATLAPPGRMCIVDDVITKGSTLLAAASRLQEAYPDANIKVLAMMRTFAFRAEHRRMDLPTMGIIRQGRYGPFHVEDWTAWPIEGEDA